MTLWTIGLFKTMGMDNDYLWMENSNAHVFNKQQNVKNIEVTCNDRLL